MTDKKINEVAAAIITEAKNVLKMGGLAKESFVRDKFSHRTVTIGDAIVAMHPEEYCFCTAGALRCAARRVDIHVIAKYDGFEQALRLVAQCIDGSRDPDYASSTIYSFNDKLETTIDDVFEKLDCALEAAK